MGCIKYWINWIKFTIIPIKKINWHFFYLKHRVVFTGITHSSVGSQYGKRAVVVQVVIIVGGLLTGLLLFFLQNPERKDGLSAYESRKGEHFTCPRDTRPHLNCTRPPTLLIVSMNGFRPDFLSEENMPQLFAFARCGVSTPYMRTSFPARTLANHYSIVTVGTHTLSLERLPPNATSR